MLKKTESTRSVTTEALRVKWLIVFLIWIAVSPVYDLSSYSSFPCENVKKSIFFFSWSKLSELFFFTGERKRFMLVTQW